MMRLVCLVLIIFPAMLALAPAPAAADSIGLGLDWRSGIYAQEYWEKGEPHYLLANLTKAPVEITVHDWQRGQPLGKALTGPWKVPAGGILLVDAKALVGANLKQFVVGGKQVIGLMPSPIAPLHVGAGYATSHGLNGSGGSSREVYVVQSKLEFEGGTAAKFVLHIPTNAGVVKFQRQAQPNNDPLRPNSLVVESAECAALTITKDEKQFVVDSQAPKGDAKPHEVVLTVQLPKGKSSQFFMLDGWLMRSDGGGNGITRGVQVAAP